MDFLSDTDTMSMTNESLGIYIKLLCHDWINDGIPDHNPTLLKIGNFEWLDQDGNLRESSFSEGCLLMVRSRFVKHPNKKYFLTNPRLQKEREKQDEWNKKSSDAGKKSWEIRKGKGKMTKSGWAKVGSGLVRNANEPLANSSSSSSSSSSSLKEINKEKKSEDPLLQSFHEYVSSRGIKNEISDTRYLEMRLEFEGKLSWWTEVRSCVDWSYDNGKKVLSAARLRNWMKNCIKYNHEKELKRQQEFQDKKNQVMKNFTPKPEPLWTPPK